MWSFIEHIPEGNLDGWYRWLTIFAIGLPVIGAIMGGVCGSGAFTVSNRIGVLQTQTVEQAKESANTANARLQFWNVSRLNAVGLSGLAGTGLQEHSEMNRIIGSYVHLDPGNFHWDCTLEALKAYTDGIKLDTKFPFTYYYSASCKKAFNIDGSLHDLETAQAILHITTQIPDHNVHHDEVLKLVEAGNLGKPETPSHPFAVLHPVAPEDN